MKRLFSEPPINWEIQKTVAMEQLLTSHWGILTRLHVKAKAKGTKAKWTKANVSEADPARRSDPSPHGDRTKDILHASEPPGVSDPNVTLHRVS